MTDEPQTSTPAENQGQWTKVTIPDGHYLKDGQIYWDPTSKAYRSMVAPKLTGGDPDVA